MTTMPSTEVGSVQSWLTRKHILPSEEWVEACVDWIHEENNATNLAQHVLNQHVLEQWLVADLREIGASCLPVDELQQQKVMLGGNYSLQVDSIVNCGTSYYSQLQKVRRQENPNTLVSADEPKQAPWEPKPSRMLMLQLTDGTHTVKAMEYKPIPALNANLATGVKVLIKGPVLCRLGMMMLTVDNIEILGGEVDSLAEENTQENLLVRALGTDPVIRMPRPNADNTHQPTVPNTGITVPQERNMSSNYGNGSGYHSNQGSNFHQNNNAVSSHVNRSAAPPVNQNCNNLNSTDEGFDQMDDEDDDFLDHIGSQALDAIENDPNTWGDDDDDFEFTEQQQLSSVIQKHSSSKNNNGVYQSSVPANSDFIDLTDEDFHDQVAFDCTKPSSIASNNTNTISNLGNNRNTIHMKGSSNANRFLNSSNDISNSTSKVQHKDLQYAQLNESTSAFMEMPDFLCDDFDTDDDFENPSNSARRSNQPPSAKKRRKAIGLHSPPYTYISVVMQHMPVTEPTLVKVKGFISTLTSKLDNTEGQWSIHAKINDGTGSMDVELGNKLLEDLIGFPARQIETLREQAKFDKKIKAKMAKGIRHCQNTLKDLSCIMEIELLPDRKEGSVIRHYDMTDADLTCLKSRTESSSW